MKVFEVIINAIAKVWDFFVSIFRMAFIATLVFFVALVLKPTAVVNAINIFKTFF